MTITDDLKAINEDLASVYDYNEQLNMARYWVIKLKNIYPDYNFYIKGNENFDLMIIEKIKVVY